MISNLVILKVIIYPQMDFMTIRPTGNRVERTDHSKQNMSASRWHYLRGLPKSVGVKNNNKSAFGGHGGP